MTRLESAIDEDDYPRIRQLLDLPTNVNEVGKSRVFLLHKTIRKGNVELVRLLLQYGSNPNRFGHNEGSTPLFHAVAANNLPLVKVLLEYGAEPHLKRKNMILSPIQKAAISGNTEMVKFILDHGCNVNFKTGDGNTVLHCAMYRNCISVVRLLLEYGADPRLVLDEAYKVTKILEKNQELYNLLSQTAKAWNTETWTPELHYLLPLARRIGAASLLSALGHESCKLPRLPLELQYEILKY